MTEERDWKAAKPKWVVDAAMAEMATLKRRAALRWPEEKEPTPSFTIVGYDRVIGDVTEGIYYIGGFGRVERCEVKPNPSDTGRYRAWLFNGSPTPARGRFFTTRHDAVLYVLWQKCDDFAKELGGLWDALDKEGGE